MVLRGRASFLRLTVVLLLFVLMGRLVWIQGVNASEITGMAEAMRLSKRSVEPVRGAILDRAGRHLAISVPIHAVIGNAIQMKDKDVEEAATKLAPLFHVDAGEIRSKLLANRESGYIPLKDGLNLVEARAVEALRLAGITVVRRVQRSYPQGFTANQVVGYVDKDVTRQYGLEARYEEELAGAPGYIEAEFTYAGIPIDGTIRKEERSVPGHDLVLTIDAALQQLAEAKLDAVVKETKAKRALAIAMNAHTGEILMMAMRPGAHPGDRSTWGDPLDFNRVFNWGTSPLPPGSIFKTITMSGALEEKVVTPTSTFIDTGRVVIDGSVISNWDGYQPASPTPMVPAELLQHSSNIGMIQVGERLGHDKFLKYLKDFGFMEKTGLDVSYEDSAIGLENFDKKRNIDWANMYIGQHLEVTPIQMIRAEAAIANGGTLVQPHLVREIRDPDGKVLKSINPEPIRRVISEQTAKEVQEMMISVVEKGTAKAAKPAGYTVGGKTGTAQKFENGRMKDRMLADFIGFAPANNPQVVLLVMIDEPEGQGYGGVVAAPIFGELMPHVMRAVGIGPDSDAAKGEEVAPPRIVTGVVPNVQWLPVARAQERLAQAGLTARVVGTGQTVASQSLKAGSTAQKGAVVELATTARGPENEPIHVPDLTGLSLSEANQLATEMGFTLKPSGTGFVADQEPRAGGLLPPRAILSVRLAPPRSSIPPSSSPTP